MFVTHSNRQLKYRHMQSKIHHQSLYGSVVEHLSAVSEGLRFDSSWGIREVFLCLTLVTRRKNVFFYYFTALKTCRLSKDDCCQNLRYILAKLLKFRRFHFANFVLFCFVLFLFYFCFVFVFVLMKATIR